MKSYFILSFLFFTSAYAYTTSEQMHAALVDTCMKIIIEQPQSVEAWVDDRFYIKPNKLHMKKQGVFVEDEDSSIALPGFGYDQNGPFLICSQEDAKEAQEHYDRAIHRLIEAFAHSMGVAAGLASIPPAALVEGYFAVEAWIDAAREYNGYCDARDRDGYADAQDRDRGRD